MKRIVLFSALIFSFISGLIAQTSPFQVYLEPFQISGLGGLQSYTYGQSGGKWLILGGRLDGLHRRQPFASFDIAGHNNQIWVIDPGAQMKWSAPLTSLPVALQEQLSSTNMEFHQEGDYLYIVGGYGYSNTAGDHKTYDNFTAVNVPAVIAAIQNGTSFTSHFRQLSDPDFAVTGGYLEQIGSTFYLVGGQKFDGRYNPMNGPSFTQEYTNQIRKFTVEDDGTNLVVTFFPPDTDTAHLHRRDYNVIPQIMPDGQEGLTAFSGVFQTVADIPYLNCVNIIDGSYSVNDSFSQYYNHYHCAHLPLYSASSNEMHNLFFGGIAQYYDSLGVLVQDNDVPFVKTIARVTRNANGLMSEHKLPVEMPALLGASAELIPLEGIDTYDNGVIRLDNLLQDTTLVGYIYGGIESSAGNIFWINDGTQSQTSTTLYKVYILKSSPNSIDDLNEQSVGMLQLQVYPNPNQGELFVKFNLDKAETVNLTLSDTAGRTILQETLTDTESGENIFGIQPGTKTISGIYFITISTQKESASQKIVIKE